MSLKAKIEAIIYAAEEPVTLAQLFGLLGLEAQAELDRLQARQATLPLPGEADLIPLPSEPDDLNDEVLDAPPPAPEDDPDELDETAAPLDETADEPPPETAGPEPSAEEPDTQEADPPGSAEAPPDPKLARARERAARDFLRSVLDELVRDYSTADRGLEIREVAGGYRLATRPEYHDAVRGFARGLKPPLKLTLQALETLAVVAYKQPITAPEVAEIRGVDSAGVLGSLIGRKLVTTAGRKQVVGRPILYKTTKDFLLRFGLRDVNELPSIEEFERMAGELNDAEPMQEEIPMPTAASEVPQDHTDPRDPQDVTGANLREEENASEPQADGTPEGEISEAIPVDGRISGPPPTEEDSVDSSAGDAAIQADQAAAEAER